MKYVWCFGLIFLLFAVDTALVFAPTISFLQSLHWNWQGKFLETLWPLLLFGFHRQLTLAEIGIHRTYNERSLWVALLAASFAWLPNIYALASGDRVPERFLDAESILYQLTMPGIAEEVVFRGALLAFFDRVLGTPWKVFGANVGWGWIMTSLLFLGVHLFSVDATGTLQISKEVASLSTILFSGFVLGWIRARTNSIWPCIFAHNIQNSIMFLGSALARI